MRPKKESRTKRHVSVRDADVGVFVNFKQTCHIQSAEKKLRFHANSRVSLLGKLPVTPGAAFDTMLVVWNSSNVLTIRAPISNS